MKRIYALVFVVQLLLVPIIIGFPAKATSEVNILDHTSFLDYDGCYHVVGEVQNVGEQAANFVKITATFYRSSDAVIATEFSYTYVNVLSTGRKSPFEIILANTTQAAQVGHYSLTVDFSTTEALPLGLEILSNSLYVDGSGRLNIVGETKNIGDQSATNVKVITTFYDEAGNVEDCEFAFSDPDELAPSQTAQFKIVLTRIGIVPSLGSYGLTAESDQYAVITEFQSTNDLVVNVVDKEDQPISGADVTVTRNDGWKTSNITDNGVAHFIQLKAGSYSIEASFESSTNTTTINLVKDKEVFLKLNTSAARTFDVTVEVLWSDEKPVSGANILIRDSNGQAEKNGVTDANGVFSASLSEGEYTIEVSKGTLNDTKNLTVDGKTLIPFTFDASSKPHTLTVKVMDHDGISVNGGLVEVKLNGITVASRGTGENAIFELEDGIYQIVVTWNSEQKKETVELTADTECSIIFQHEIPFDLIIYITAIVVSVVTICVLVLYIRKRRQRMFPFSDLHP